jgi:hypothetical protein
MPSPDLSAPRRYIFRPQGDKILIGLSPEETREFERLEAELASGDHSADFEGMPPSPDKARWLELYTKHERACEIWSLFYKSD